MQRPRFYCETVGGDIVELSPEQSHHLAVVLRLPAAAAVELFDGRGKLAAGSVEKVDARKATVRIERVESFPATQKARIIIAPSVAKGDRFDWLIGKCTEIGVDHICPVIFERTVRQPKNPTAFERWHRIAVESAKQSRRLFLPRIDRPAALAHAVESLCAEYAPAKILLGSPQADAEPISAESFGDADVIALVGPEGGLTEEETELVKAAGAKAVRLSGTILRVETAAICFAAVLAAKRCAETPDDGFAD